MGRPPWRGERPGVHLRRGRVADSWTSSSKTTALAAIPSTRPRAPRPSEVVAFTETQCPTTRESSSDMAGMNAASFGRSAMIVTSADSTRSPAP